MVINWSENAIKDIKKYKLNSKVYTEIKLQRNIKSLIEYVDNLLISPRLGKALFINDFFEIRQLIYKKHKILYCLKDDEICILSVIHTKYNNNILNYLINLL